MRELFREHIIQAFHVPPTPEQAHAADVFSQFMADREERVAMVLRGSAGTGKTTLAASIVRALTALRQKLVLLAPTGRAAKVLSLYAHQPAYTIHRRIYRQKTAGALSAFTLNANLQRDTLFIVDEASMISTELAPPAPADSTGSGYGTFGSGSLLDDLMAFVYSGVNCRLLLIGDRAQLPPVGQEESPALRRDVIAAYRLKVYEADLRQVLRQTVDSGILYNATTIRSQLEAGTPSPALTTAAADSPAPTTLPRILTAGFSDVRVVPGDELIEQLASSYSQAGMDDTIVITRSNKRANIYNHGIRATVLDREDELCRGDQLMIVKNNYFWLHDEAAKAQGGLQDGSGQPHAQGGFSDWPGTQPIAQGLPSAQPGTRPADPVPDFLANGDIAVVQRIRHIHQLYGFRFADVTLTLPDYDDYELTATVILDTLTSEAPALTREQQEQLYRSVMDDYADIPLKSDRLKKLKQDPHYNALQVKFAYAVTCHKAQGGQWSHVYIDQGYMTDDMLTPDYLHWLYTAFTRATSQLFLVNWPKTQLFN